jgi:Mg-chelatase subunit ChlD
VLQLHAADTTATMRTVHDLVTSGDAIFTVLERRETPTTVEFDLSLFDQKGDPYLGYAVPYLKNIDMTAALWKDFISGPLNTPAGPDQIAVKEIRIATKRPYAVAFVLDHSASMTQPRAIRMQSAIRHAMSSFDTIDYVTVFKFTGIVRKEVSLTRDSSEYMQDFKVNGLNLRSTGTAVYDATIRATRELRDAPENARRIIILFTDGEDNSSTATLDEAIGAVQEDSATVYAITYGVTNSRPLRQLSEITGGSIHSIDDVADFDRVFLGIYNSLRNTYRITVTGRQASKPEDVQRAVTSAGGGPMMPGADLDPDDYSYLLPSSGVTREGGSTMSGLLIATELGFKPNTFDLRTEDAPTLDSLATLLIQRSDLTAEIIIPTWPSDTPEQIADARRASTRVRELLIKRGVNPSRVESSPQGGTHPVLQRIKLRDGDRRVRLFITKL